MTRDEKFINLALKIAQKSEHHFPIGAIIAYGSCVLSIGINKYRTHPRQDNQYTKQKATSIHAELDAIISCHNTKGATIYVARSLFNGSNGLAKPCKFCQDIIRTAGIKKIVYTTYDGFEILGEKNE